MICQLARPPLIRWLLFNVKKLKKDKLYDKTFEKWYYYLKKTI